MRILAFFIFFLSSVFEPPTIYEGRIRSHDAATYLWLNDFSSDAPNIAWGLHLKGYEAYLDTPFYSTQTSKKLLSHRELKHQLIENPDSGEKTARLLVASQVEIPGLKTRREGDQLLILAVPEQLPWAHLKPGAYVDIQSNKSPSEEILRLFGLIQRFEANAADLFLMLPDRFQKGKWHNLSTLRESESNFTLFSDGDYARLREAYLSLTDGPSDAFRQAFERAYSPIAGTVALSTPTKNLLYPSKNQLSIESLYYRLPLVKMALVGYLIAAILLILRYRRAGFVVCGLAFALHTLLLLIRCYILWRPPVANMVETVLYVPWIAVAAGWGLVAFRQSSLILAISAISSALMLLLTLFIYPLHPLDPVPAVLDSQFWLTIHVLMVVGSYGVFLLSSLLGHVYLFMELRWKYFGGPLSITSAMLSRAILYALYVGTGLLICGTVLGGIWAAQSWGRFWDWDPKESWAFISSCAYLIAIHCYRFKKIGDTGLAFSAALGFLVITFTWYGVNYILGTGLHSYGFGHGGESYYYAFLALDLALLASFAYGFRQKSFLT